jgi:hypothetical protein
MEINQLLKQGFSKNKVAEKLGMLGPSFIAGGIALNE